MECKACSEQLQNEDTFCPNCGSKTGVEARKDFKKSLRFSGFGCGTVILVIIYIVVTANTLSPDDSEKNGLKGAVFLGVPIAIIGALFALRGLNSFFKGRAKKNYKLVKKSK
jgi:hypothetical protein